MGEVREWKPSSSTCVSCKPLKHPPSLLFLSTTGSPLDRSASRTYWGQEQFWVFLGVGFAAPHSPLHGLLPGITFSHWPVGRQSGHHQMSHSLQPFFWATQTQHLHSDSAPPHFRNVCRACLLSRCLQKRSQMQTGWPHVS